MELFKKPWKRKPVKNHRDRLKNSKDAIQKAVDAEKAYNDSRRGWKEERNSLVKSSYPAGGWYKVPNYGDSIEMNAQEKGLPFYRHTRDTSKWFDTDSANYYLKHGN